MTCRRCATLITLAVLPLSLAAQATTAATAAAPAASASPVADALRQMQQRYARILVGAAEAMPAEKYNYRPTPAQMSFAMIQAHLANEGNDMLCSKVAGVPAPQRTAADSTLGKDALVARLKEPFQLFGPNPFTRAAAIMITVGDWADHYSQEANYLRLNAILPPTAQRRSM